MTIKKEANRDIRTEFLNIIKFSHLFNTSAQKDLGISTSTEDQQKMISNHSKTRAVLV